MSTREIKEDKDQVIKQLKLQVSNLEKRLTSCKQTNKFLRKDLGELRRMSDDLRNKSQALIGSLFADDFQKTTDVKRRFNSMKNTLAKKKSDYKSRYFPW